MVDLSLRRILVDNLTVDLSLYVRRVILSVQVTGEAVTETV